MLAVVMLVVGRLPRPLISRGLPARGGTRHSWAGRPAKISAMQALLAPNNEPAPVVHSQVRQTPDRPKLRRTPRSTTTIELRVPYHDACPPRSVAPLRGQSLNLVAGAGGRGGFGRSLPTGPASKE